jgi:P27 family predicted phage terminase small subunit
MLRLVGGNAGRRLLNEAEPAPEAGIPDPPAELGKKALAEWRSVAEPLYHAGILTKLDRAALAAYCQSYARWVQAEQVLTRMAATDPVTGGLVIRTSNGNVALSADQPRRCRIPHRRRGECCRGDRDARG